MNQKSLYFQIRINEIHMRIIVPLFLMIAVFTLSNIGIQAQEENIETLSVGVNVGETFTFSVSSSEGPNPNLYLVLFPQDVGADFNAPMPSEFIITITNIVSDEQGEFCWSTGDFDDPCVYYQPRIEISFSSDEFNGNSSINFHIGDGVITTTDWERVDSYYAELVDSQFFSENGEVRYSRSEEGNHILLNLEVDFNNVDDSVFGFKSAESSQVIRYDRSTGVLQESRTTGFREYANGTIENLDQIIKNSIFISDGPNLLSLNSIEISIIIILPVLLYRRRH